MAIVCCCTAMSLPLAHVVAYVSDLGFPASRGAEVLSVMLLSSFVSRAILKWLTESGIHTAHIDPGKPWQNGTDESFNGKFRDECLSLEWFRSREEARVVIETWRRHYNSVRPHSSLEYLTPQEFKLRYDSINPGAVSKL